MPHLHTIIYILRYLNLGFISASLTCARTNCGFFYLESKLCFPRHRVVQGAVTRIYLYMFWVNIRLPLWMVTYPVYTSASQSLPKHPRDWESTELLITLIA